MLTNVVGLQIWPVKLVALASGSLDDQETSNESYTLLFATFRNMFSWNDLATLCMMVSGRGSAMNRTLGAWEMRPDKSRRGVNDQTAAQHLLMTALSKLRATKYFV
jgi:hypothetical protein